MILDFLNHPKNGVYFLTPSKKDFEEIYRQVRSKENRLLEDEQVKILPFLPPLEMHHMEWKKRQFTLKKFLKYKKEKRFQKVLDIGCGNGWFTNQLSSKTEIVIGLDIVEEELTQAARCFQKENLHFLCCTDLSLLPKNSFDLITFNASIQYFNLHSDFWQMLNSLLGQFGEIHILDSPIYYKKDQESAKNRSKTYFDKIGETNAISFYNHLIWNNLPSGYSILYRPKKWKLKVFKNRSPFTWLMIQKRL